MKNSSTLYCLLMVTISALSCTRGDIPQRGYICTTPVMMKFTENSAKKFALLVNANSAEAQMGISVKKQLAISADACVGFTGYGCGELGLVFHRKLEEENYFELGIGYCMGYMDSQFAGSTDFFKFPGFPPKSEASYSIATLYHKLYVQPSLVAQPNAHRSTALTLKVVPAYFIRYDYSASESTDNINAVKHDAILLRNKLFFILEPGMAFTFKNKPENFAVMLQLGGAFALNRVESVNQVYVAGKPETQRFKHPDIKNYYIKVGCEFYFARSVSN